jgi:hypothetical protein
MPARPRHRVAAGIVSGHGRRVGLGRGALCKFLIAKMEEDVDRGGCDLAPVEGDLCRIREKVDALICGGKKTMWCQFSSVQGNE